MHLNDVESDYTISILGKIDVVFILSTSLKTTTAMELVDL